MAPRPLMNVDEALRLVWPQVAAWDLDLQPDGSRALTVFDLASGAPVQAAWRTWPEEQVASVTAAFAQQSVITGHHDGVQGVVWQCTPDAVQAWNQEKRVIHACGGIIVDRINRVFSVDSIRAFIGYVEEDYVDRGIKAEFTDGTQLTLAFILSAHAASDPTYNRNDLLMDSSWISMLGSALARWAGRPFRDLIMRPA